PTLFRSRRDDRRGGRGDDGDDVLVQALAVVAANGDIDLVDLLGGLAPVDVDDAVRIAARQAQQARTVGAMHRYAAATRDVATHRVARQRLAALRKRGQQIADALDAQRFGDPGRLRRW